MKLSAAFAGLVGLAVASPYTEHDTSNGLIGECNYGTSKLSTYRSL
jgi:hypothetical protein